MLKEYNGQGYIFDSACDYKNLIIRVTPEAKDLVKVMENCYADKFLVTQICKNCEFARISNPLRLNCLSAAR